MSMMKRTGLKRAFCISLATVFTTTGLTFPSLAPSLFRLDFAIAKTQKPTLAQIEEAKKTEAAKRAAAQKAASQLNQATKTLRQLTAIANQATANYRKAQQDLQIAIVISQRAAKHAALAAKAVTAANNEIGKLATHAYIMGGGFTDLDSILHANGPQDLIDRMNTLSQLGEGNSTALKRYEKAATVARAAKKSADVAKAAQVVATERVAATKKIADDAKAAQQIEVDKLQKVQDLLAKELVSAKKFRITLEQQRALALLEEANAAKATTIKGQAKIWPDRGFKGRTTIRSTDAIRASAVAYAKKQVLARKPYIWGAQGPNAFDCSGLVYAAYRAGGLGYPNWSRLNAALYWVDSKRIPLTQLIPGDLLFYSYNGTVQSIHHITIYAGNGMMWEANSRGKGLLFSSIYSINGLMPYGGRV